MGRNIRNTVILAKIETTYGLDATPGGTTDALLVSNLSINPLNAQNQSREIIRKYLGNSEEIVGTRYKECSFDIELVGSGTPGTAPPLGPPLRACGFAEVVTASTRVDYTPISANFESLTIYWYDDGVLHKLVGARGTATLDASQGAIPKLKFKFVGKDGGDVVDPLPATTLTAWRVPQTVIDANSGDLTFGCTHSSTGAPVLAGGTPYPSQGITIDFGVQTPFNALLGGESVPITDRKMTASVKLELTATQEIAFLTAVKLTELISVGLQHGTIAGDMVMLFLPSAQRLEPTKEDLNGARLNGYKLNVNPKVGNDELRLVFY